MADFAFTSSQNRLLSYPSDQKIFLYGKNGCGKTTVGVERVRMLLDAERTWSEILAFAPSRTLLKPYTEPLSRDGLRPKAMSYDSFIQRSLELFWPVISGSAGFAYPEKAPHFLTIETAQVLMFKTVEDKIDQGYFNALDCPRSRIFNQVMISMRKCAGAEIPYETYSQRMRRSWGGDPALLPVFSQAQECGELFRAACFRNNLLDYALQVETFTQHLLPLPLFREWLAEKQLYFVYDNAEEDVPAAHHLARELIRCSRGALIICDQNGGFRNFLGCDPVSAESLKTECDTVVEFSESITPGPAVAALEIAVDDPRLANSELPASPRSAFEMKTIYQYPNMVKQASADIADLIHTYGVKPSEIVILAPLVSDVLYTSMERSLREQGVKVYLHRPSRPLLNEPVTRALVTLCALIHSYEGIETRFLDIVQMLQTLIPSLDPIRGQVLVAAAFRKNALQDAERPETVSDDRDTEYRIRAFSSLPPQTRSRIPQEAADAFELLRGWILSSRGYNETPDELILRFFNELLVQDGFNSGDEMTIGVKKMIESARHFRELKEATEGINDAAIPGWNEFFRMIGLGMVSANYYEENFAQPEDSVLISLTSAYLSMDRPVDYQFWLNVGSPRWCQRFYGQLTNDAILSAQWQSPMPWGAADEIRANDAHMTKQICGLLRRCRKQVRLYSSELSESGQSQKSNLLYLFSVLQRRFKSDKPTEPQQFDFPMEIREEAAVYPGINDKYVNNPDASLFIDDGDPLNWGESYGI